jgi:hypothetical protein
MGTLKYFERFTDVKQAIAREKQLKGWSGAKKEALFAEDYDLLKALPKSSVQQARLQPFNKLKGDTSRTTIFIYCF